MSTVPYVTSEDLETELVAFLERFLASDDGEQVAAALSMVDGPAVLEIAVWHPDVTLAVDLRERTVTLGPHHGATASVGITAVGLHNLLLDRLGPVEISRLFEEDDMLLEGPPQALAALLLVAEPLHRHYVESLRERGRVDLLETEAPETAVIWESAETPPRVFGIRRPWQPEKSTRAQKVS